MQDAPAGLKPDSEMLSEMESKQSALLFSHIKSLNSQPHDVG